MSLLNAWVGKDRALVAVDTDGLITSENRHISMSKLIPLVHAMTVVAARGDRAFLHYLFSYFFLSSTNEVGRGYDEMVDSAPHAIATINAHWSSLEAPATKYQFVLVGWSARQDRMCGQRYDGLTDEGEVDVNQLGSLVAPSDCFSKPTVPCDHGSIAKLAKEQSNWLLANGEAGGGKLIIAELRKGRIDLTARSID